MTQPVVPEVSAIVPAAKPEPWIWAEALLLKCRVQVEIPVPHFSVATLLELSEGAIVDSGWMAGKDVPVKVNGKAVGTCEFDVVADRLAARITEIGA